jgi:hypothetical protein
LMQKMAFRFQGIAVAVYNADFSIAHKS